MNMADHGYWYTMADRGGGYSNIYRHVKVYMYNHYNVVCFCVFLFPPSYFPANSHRHAPLMFSSPPPPPTGMKIVHNSQSREGGREHTSHACVCVCVCGGGGAGK